MARDFQITRDRDAWAAIRGFVYQVQHTILRWLELPPGTALEPEHGEDIDIVQSALTPGVDTDRVLQQIKYRERDITLNSSEIRAALADFFEHTRTNPQLNLQFQFMTNARPQRERPSYFPMRVPGIVAWGLVAHASEPLGVTEVDHMNAIRRTVRDVPRPQDYPTTAWTNFQQFWKDCADDQLLAFVRHVEIKCSEMEPPDLTDQIRSTLVAAGRCADQSQARVAYERLFCFVFDMLARRGPRRLGPEELATALAAVPFTPAQEVLLSQLRWIAEHVTDLEPKVEKLEERIAAAMVEMEVLGSDLRLANALEIIAEPPPQPALLAPRVQAVAQLAALIAQHSFVALHGSPGSGKTQLARAAAAAPNHIRAWLSLSGYDSAKAASYLSLFRARLLAASQSIQEGALIVVDDTPAMPIGSTLAASLVGLHRSTIQLGCRTLCISEHRILAAISPVTLGSTVAEFESPPLTSEDILGMLQQRGAPSRFLTEQWRAVFAGITHRHMLLFVAMLAYLIDGGWQVDEDALVALLGGEFAQGLAPAASERLFRSVPDERTRELLHRVRLATGPITENALSELADAPIRIPEPLLRIAPIEGVWLLRDSRRRLVVSPLVRALPPATLLLETTCSCHGVLADTLLRPEGILPFDVKRALFHLSGSMRWRQHDALLAASLASALSNREMVGAKYLLADLARHPISQAATEDDRISVLALQFSALRGRGRRCESILQDLSSLLNRRALPDLRVATAAALIGQHLSGVQQVQYTSLMVQAIGSDALEVHGSWKGMLAISGMRLDSKEAVLAWINIFIALPCRIRDELMFDDPLFGSIIVSACNVIWIQAPNLDSETTNSIAEMLDQIRALGRTASIPLLECAAASAMILALTDSPAKRYDDADGIVPSAIATGAQDSRGRFLVYAAVAFAHRLKGEISEALAAYVNAFEGPIFGVEYDAAWASMLAAVAAADRPTLAAMFLEKGALAARTPNVCTALITARVLLELGVARWIAGTDAWHQPLLEGVALVLFEPVDSIEWRSVVTRIGHYLGCIVAKVVHDLELTNTADGTPYRKPWIGAFRESDVGAATHYSSEREAAVAARAVTLSHYFGEHQQASRFVRHALDLSYDRSDVVSAGGLSDIAGYLLAEDLVEDILAAAFEVGSRTNGSSEESIKNDLWQQGDRAVALFAFVPVVLRIAQYFIHDRVKGITFLRRATEAFLQLETDNRSGKPWSNIVHLIEAAANGTSSLEEDGKTISTATGWAAAVIHHGCLLLMSVHPKSTPSDAAMFQALTLPTIWKMLDRDVTSQDLLLSEFVKSYWQNALQVDTYRFTAPAEVARRVDLAVSARSSAHRIAGILESVWVSLGTPIQSETRQWIDSLKAKNERW